MNHGPQSRLTRERPEIWANAVSLVAAATGMQFPHKAPLFDGTIYACGYTWVPTTPPRPPTPAIDPAKRKEIETEIARIETEISELTKQEQEKTEELEKLSRRIDELTNKLRTEKNKIQAVSVVVPEGAMEWLLHEAGHWIAATPEERRHPNYSLSASETGHDGDRELQAWAFEQIVLAPFAPDARTFAPLSQRDGAAFNQAGPLSQHAFARIEQQISAEGIDLDQWRAVFAPWVQWGRRANQFARLS